MDAESVVDRNEHKEMQHRYAPMAFDPTNTPAM
jgi:hypothetical protein